MMKTRFLHVLALVPILLSGCEKAIDPNVPGYLVPKTADQDASVPAIVVNGARLHAETFGNPTDPMLVVLHGGPGSDYRYVLKCQELSTHGYFVVFYDQRGSGLSQRFPSETYNLQIMQDDLAAVIEHYRTSPNQKIFLFGLSWGAMLATAYINTYPDAIRGVVLAEPGGFTLSDVKNFISRSQSLNLDESTNDAFYMDQILTGSNSHQEELDYKVALRAAHDYAPGNILGNAGPSPFWRYGAVAQKSLLDNANKNGFDWTTHLQLFTTKVLFLYSENNKAYGPAYAAHVSSAYPNVQLEMIHNTGHSMVYYGWNEIQPLALEYFDSLK